MALGVEDCWQSTEISQLVFFLLYKRRWILLSFPHLLCSDFAAAALISLHCGLGGDISIMWGHINLVWQWCTAVVLGGSIELTPGSAFNAKPSSCCALRNLQHKRSASCRCCSVCRDKLPFCDRCEDTGTRTELCMFQVISWSSGVGTNIDGKCTFFFSMWNP